MICKIIFFLNVLVGFSAFGHVMDSTNADCELPDSLMYVDVMALAPKFPGGCDSLYRFINTQLVYPCTAVERKIEGRVNVRFEINKSGEVKYIEIDKGVSSDLDAEAIRIIGLLPKWEPADYEGRKVNMNYVIPIQFSLEKANNCR